jgi:hypothetical protein
MWKFDLASVYQEGCIYVCLMVFACVPWNVKVQFSCELWKHVIHCILITLTIVTTSSDCCLLFF